MLSFVSHFKTGQSTTKTLLNFNSPLLKASNATRQLCTRPKPKPLLEYQKPRESPRPPSFYKTKSWRPSNSTHSLTHTCTRTLSLMRMQMRNKKKEKKLKYFRSTKQKTEHNKSVATIQPPTITSYYRQINSHL